MTIQPVPMSAASPIGRGLLLAACATAGAVMALAVAVLVGYALKIDSLVFVLAKHQGMAPLTAVGLLAVASGLLLETFKRRRAAAVAAWGALALSLIAILQQSLLGHDALNPHLAAVLFQFDPARSGRTSVATAAALAFLSLAVLLRDRSRTADALAGLTFLIAALALLGYLYDVRDLYAIPIFDTMALHTALALFALSLATVFSRPQTGWAAVVSSARAGGSATRRQLGFTLLPPLVGWWLLHAVHAHQLGISAAMAMLIAVVILPLAWLILRDGRMLDAVDMERDAKVELEHGLKNQLQQRLAQQAQELAAQGAKRAEAEAALAQSQRLETVGRLTGGIAHDFNNVLMGIGGNVELLLKLLPAEDALRRFAQNAKNGVARGAKLTTQLLAFSRLQKLNIRLVELDPLLQATQSLFTTTLGPGVRVEWDLQAADEWTLADPDQLELALINIALNARDALPTQGGAVRVKSLRIAHRGRNDSTEREYLAVRVIDTGSGMSPEVLARAVEPFFTTKPHGKGSGLGLAQVHGLLTQCNGELRIESEPGQGTCVELLFPVTTQRPVADAPEAARETEHAATPRPLQVLVIDDDEQVRPVLVEHLRAAGHRVTEAHNGTEGVARLLESAPDLAVIDFMMPDMNGAEVASRARARYPRLPIVFVSGYFDTAALSQTDNAVVLRKPFDLPDLQRALTQALRH